MAICAIHFNKIAFLGQFTEHIFFNERTFNTDLFALLILYSTPQKGNFYFESFFMKFLVCVFFGFSFVWFCILHSEWR